MPTTEEIKNVPKKKVAKIVDGHINDGATRITVNKSPTSGKWDIKATFP